MNVSQGSPHLQTQLQDGFRLNFSWPFSYISFSSLTFPGTRYWIFLLFLPWFSCHFYLVFIEQQPSSLVLWRLLLKVNKNYISGQVTCSYFWVTWCTLTQVYTCYPKNLVLFSINCIEIVYIFSLTILAYISPEVLFCHL